MLGKILFQIHWLAGITAGTVLAVVGLTGGMLAFEHELLALFNPGVLRVAPAARKALSPVELIGRVQAANPGRRIVSLTVSADPTDTARVGFAADAQFSQVAPGGQRRGETRYVEPYSGEVLDRPAGEAFFRTVTQVHRYLASGDVGKQIVGASTLGLVVLALSGLYLRWPRGLFGWRTWLWFNWAHKGRAFLWGLHSVIGTWVLLCYLLAALTGLYWSYNWYRDALFSITGAPRPVQANAPARAPTADKSGREAGLAGSSDGSTEIGLAWDTFRNEVSGFSTATLRLPEKPGQPLQITYLDSDPPHQRAANRILLDPVTGRIAAHERYADKPAGGKIMSSIFSLHSGSFFGLPGSIVMMLASLALPLSAMSGWMLYLQRRRATSAMQVVGGRHGDA